MPTLTIRDEWQSAFGSALPAGFLCRLALSDRWLRIHSLAESKRYPASERDHTELLARQNTVAEYVLGDASECILFVTRFGERETFSSDIPLGGRVPEHVLRFYDEEGEDEFQFFALRVTWRKEVFNELIVACAEDKTGPILIANIANNFQKIVFCFLELTVSIMLL